MSAAIEPVRVGVIGAGDISDVYLNAITRSPLLDLRAIATRSPDRAEATANRFCTSATHLADLLRDEAVELVLNLTPGKVHGEINEAAIAAGKHVYSEKPFTLSGRSALRLARLADAKGVLIGSAPDTFYGSAHQAVRTALDQGLIGKPVFGSSFLGLPGLELFHPSPSAFYQPGGEPPFDVGPYYIAMWINLLGPVRKVYAAAGRGQAERTIRRGPKSGESFAVEVDTTFNAILEFEGASVSLVMSLDVVTPTLRPGELFGAAGMLSLADPMFFSGEPGISQSMGDRRALATEDLPFADHNRLDHVGRPVADYRGVGLTDLALAIRTGSRHRTSADFIIHSVEVMEAIAASARNGRVEVLQSTCKRPAPLDPQRDALLIELTASPFDF